MLSLVEPLIKKYCNYKFEDDYDEGEPRSHLIYESDLYLGNIPIRAYAAACHIRFTWHLPTLNNISLVSMLSEDSNSHVREAVSGELSYLHEIKPILTLEIAKRYCSDNKFVRWFLRYFLKYLLHKDRKQALELLSFIVEKYGKTLLVGMGEDILLRFAVNAITQDSLLLNENQHLKIFENMITDSGYSMYVKKEIIITMRKDRFIEDQNLSDKVVYYCKEMLTSDCFELKAHIEFFLLYQLIKKKISLLPKIEPLLDEIANIRYPKPILKYDQIYHFTILDYICLYFESFPQFAVTRFLKIINTNEFLINSIKINIVIKILTKIFDSNVEISYKKDAKVILAKIDNNYWQVGNLKEKSKDL